MTKAALQPIHHILAQDYITIIDKLYVSFNIEAEKHEYDLVLIIDTLKKLKSGEITLGQIEVTDDAWEVLDADMAPPTQMETMPPADISKASPNGAERSAKRKAKNAVPATPS